jgi:hypothetical protein
MSMVLIMASLPMVVSVVIPMPCARATARTPVASAPLCRATPTGPAVSGGGMPRAKTGERDWAFRKPRQFGPSRTIPCCRALATMASSRARPASPTSR